MIEVNLLTDYHDKQIQHLVDESEIVRIMKNRGTNRVYYKLYVTEEKATYLTLKYGSNAVWST